jgi:hypothetical protein
MEMFSLKILLFVFVCFFSICDNSFPLFTSSMISLFFAILLQICAVKYFSFMCSVISIGISISVFYFSKEPRYAIRFII